MSNFTYKEEKKTLTGPKLEVKYREGFFFFITIFFIVFGESWQKVEGTIRIRMGVKRRSNGGMFKHTKSKKASNSQLEFQTQPATDGRHLFVFFFFSHRKQEAATTGGARLTLIPFILGRTRW